MVVRQSLPVEVRFWRRLPPTTVQTWVRFRPMSMTLDQLLTAAASFFTASIVLTLWRASAAPGSTDR